MLTDRFQSQGKRIVRQWHRIQRACRMQRMRYVTAIRGLIKGLGVVTLLASVGCLICCAAYIGYERDPSEIASLRTVFNAIRAIFTVNVLAALLLDFRHTVASTRILKWIADIAVAATFLPAIIPAESTPWLHGLVEPLALYRVVIPVLAFYSAVDISYLVLQIFNSRTNPPLILATSFLIFITIGSFLLMMPKCTLHPISYVDSLFVATSAVCITGLTPVDVPTTFTPMGMTVLALLIQTGGLGVLTFTSFFALFFSGNTSVYSQLVVKDMVYSKSINSLMPTLLYILGFTIVVEALGAAAIWWSIYDVLPWSMERQIWFSVFHSVSAFCNAGFSTMPGGLSNPLLMNSNQSIYLTISVIAMAGAIGFPVLVNFRDACGEYLRRLWAAIRGRRMYGRMVHLYNINTKLSVYWMTGLFAFGAVAFWLLEHDNTLAGFNLYDQAVQSVFNSVTPRSVGFASVSPTAFLDTTVVMILFLMWVGGASQSTAGGIKVNTLAAMWLNLRASVLGRERVEAYNRTVSARSIRRAGAVVTLSILFFTFYCITIIHLNPAISTKAAAWEAASALFTVGSSLGATPELTSASKMILCTAMFLGRVGIISMLIGITGNRHNPPVGLPTDDIIIN